MNKVLQKEKWSLMLVVFRQMLLYREQRRNELMINAVLQEIVLQAGGLSSEFIFTGNKQELSFL